jgi:hypothetical protein
MLAAESKPITPACVYCLDGKAISLAMRDTGGHGIAANGIYEPLLIQSLIIILATASSSMQRSQGLPSILYPV